MIFASRVHAAARLDELEVNDLQDDNGHGEQTKAYVEHDEHECDASVVARLGQVEREEARACAISTRTDTATATAALRSPLNLTLGTLGLVDIPSISSGRVDLSNGGV